CRPWVTSVWASASMSAVSIPGIADPVCASLGRQVGSQRTHKQELAAPRPRFAHGTALDMLADAAAGDRGILQRHPAKGQHDVALVATCSQVRLCFVNAS